MHRRRWLWILLFVLVVVTLAGLTTGWNVVLVHDYHQLIELAHSISIDDAEKRFASPWVTIVLGLLVFLIALLGTILFFVRLLQEMRVNQLQSEFLASVSHALKTPIATIELSSSMLKKGDLSPEETAQLWNSHQSELIRLKDQVNMLLEAARFQGGSVKPKRSLVSMETWIASSMLRWRQILGPHAIFTRKGGPLSCEAWIDPNLLDLITDNLIDNSRKFAKIQPVVSIETELKASHWTLTFSDQGWGFPQEDSEKLFTRFFRSKNDAPYSISGTGLGLYLVATAAKSIGIKIEARSEGIGKGAKFILEGRRVRS